MQDIPRLGLKGAIMRKYLFAALLIVPLMVGSASGKSITWDANTEPDLAGYRVYLRDLPSGSFTIGLDVVTTPGEVHIIPLADLGVTTEGHEFYVTAYDTSGNESDPSNTVNDEKPGPPSGCRIIP